MDKLSSRREDLLDGLDGCWLKKYDWLRKSLCDTDVSTDKEYQDRFYDFYFPEGTKRSQAWYDLYFCILEREKRNPLASFDDILDELHIKRLYPVTGVYVETSFTSKLVAAIIPDNSIYDTYVRKAFGWKRLRPSISNARTVYGHLVAKTSTLVGDARFAELRESFNQKFHEYCHFTDTKKLDFYLWAYGRTLQ